MKKILVVLACGWSLIAPLRQGTAQTTFAWPDSKVNLKSYHYLDNCVVVGARVWDSIGAVEGIFSDTVYSPRGQIGKLTPGKVQASLQECLSNYTPAHIPREYALLAQKAYLHAGQFAEADAVVHRGLSQIAATDTASRAALIDSAVAQYAKNPPFQLHLAQAWIDTLERSGTAYRPWNLFRNYFWLMHAAYVAGEDSLAIRSGRRMIDLAPSATKGANAQEVAAVGIGVSYALRITRGNEILDSLRKGTAAYASLYAANFRKAMGFVPTEQARDVDAPVLQGDYWFPKAAADQEYPRKGRVSMLVFMDDRTGMIPVQLQALSVVRRLSSQYPTVDLLLATSTMGFFGPLEPPTSDREAFLSDSLFRNFHRLNPVLSVAKGTFIQLEAPDNRRVYQPYANIEAYPPQMEAFRGKNLRIYLIDDHRRIVDILPANVQEEGWTMRLLAALLGRLTAQGAQ